MSETTGRPNVDDPDRSIGLVPKFRVQRTDPEAQGRHPDCRHFVLDLDHDAFATPAILAYADACADLYPLLAADLRASVS